MKPEDREMLDCEREVFDAIYDAMKRLEGRVSGLERTVWWCRWWILSLALGLLLSCFSLLK